MSLDIGAALREGFDRTTERNALLLFGAFLIVALANLVLFHTIMIGLGEWAVQFAEQQGQDPGFELSEVRETFPLALPLPLALAAVLLLALAVVSETVSIVAVRTFASEDRRAFPAGVGRRPGWATANGFVGGIIVRVLIFIGLLLLVIPGVFLFVAFAFFRQEVAIEDENFIDAMTASWRRTAGNRLELFALLLVLIVARSAVEVLGSGVSAASQVAGHLVNAGVLALLSVFVTAVVTRAYVQLQPGASPDAPPEEPEDEEDEYSGALGPEDLDPPE